MLGNHRRLRMERGSALIVVLGTMIVLIMFATVALTFAVQSNKFARYTNDDSGAFVAAQAGVEDYTARLNANNTYWKTTDCSNMALQGPSTSPSPPCGQTATTAVGYIAVPSSVNSDGRAQFHYDIDTSQTPVYGNITVTATGKVGNATRTVQALVRQPSFSEFGRVLDKTTLDPSETAFYGKNNTAVAAACSHYLYEKTTDPAPNNVPRPNIYPLARPNGSTAALCNDPFIGGPTATLVPGPSTPYGGVHYNDEMELINNAYFNAPVTTSWIECLTGTPNSTGGTTMLPGGRSCYNPYAYETTDSPLFLRGISYHPPVTIPTSIGNLRQYVDPLQTPVPGCLYTGPTRIKFNANAGGAAGTMTVWSNFSQTPLNPGCGNYQAAWPQTLPLPNNNIIIVQNVPSTQTLPATGKCLPGTIGDGIPLVNDDNQNLPTADCRFGNAYIDGTVNGRVTVSTDNDIVITGDLLYNNGKTGNDTLGLLSSNDVSIYHPIALDTSTGTNLLTPAGTTQQNPQIYADIVTLQHTFNTINCLGGAPLGYIYAFGAGVQRYQGCFSYFDGNGNIVHGYGGARVYDVRLALSPPPYFPVQPGYGWATKTLVEVPTLYK